MLSSISPFGERSRNSRWGLTVTAYVVGSVAGGATAGLGFGLLGELVSPAVQARAGLAIVAIAGVVGVLADLRLFHLRVPTLHRQVNEDWLTTYRGWVYGVGFGYQLGLSFATIVTTSTVWLTWLAVVLAGSWTWGIVIGAWFGLARGLLILATTPVQDPTQLRRLFHSIEVTAPHVQRVAIVSAGLAALTAAGGLLS